VALLDLFRRTPWPKPPGALEEHAALANQVEILTESLGRPRAAAREDVGWRKVGGTTGAASPAPSCSTPRVCLVAYIKSPLIGRGLRIRRNYVWGGASRSPPATVSEEDAAPPVNDLHPGARRLPEYKRVLGSAQAREEREVNLHTAGRVLPPRRARRRASHGAAPAGAGRADRDYIANPDDPNDVWLYKRTWTTAPTCGSSAPTGACRPADGDRTEWHPTLEYRPAEPAGPGGPDRRDPVRWDQPIQHCAVNSSARPRGASRTCTRRSTGTRRTPTTCPAGPG
jgi:hypothetical protein